MKCYNCNEEMIVGKTSLSASVIGFLAYGFSHKNLTFKTQDSKRKIVLGNDEAKTAYYCQSCGSMFIDNNSNQLEKIETPDSYTVGIQDGEDTSKIIT